MPPHAMRSGWKGSQEQPWMGMVWFKALRRPFLVTTQHLASKPAVANTPCSSGWATILCTAPLWIRCALSAFLLSTSKKYTIPSNPAAAIVPPSHDMAQV